MYHKIIKVLAYLSLSFLLACKPEPEFPIGNVQGYLPIYATADMLKISFGSSRPVNNPEKIIRYKNYLLINEFRKGIHFFDNSDASAPIALGFLEISGNVDMDLRNDVLYVDHINSLVGLDISSVSNIKEVSRTRIWSSTVPPKKGYYFICVDSTKEVVDWSISTLISPKCYR